MQFDVWLTFVAASAVLLMIPGPTVLLVLSYALTQGRKVAVATVLGVALGDFVAMTASLLGLGALVMASATVFSVLKWLGALYLIWLGVKLLRSTPPEMLSVEDVPQMPARGVFLHMASVTVLNPKTIAFFVAFVPHFLQPAQPLAPQFAILIGTFVMLGVANALAYALLADTMRARIKRPGTLRLLNRIGGSAVVGMGLLTMTLRRS